MNSISEDELLAYMRSDLGNAFMDRHQRLAIEHATKFLSILSEHRIDGLDSFWQGATGGLDDVSQESRASRDGFTFSIANDQHKLMHSAWKGIHYLLTGQ